MLKCQALVGCIEPQVGKIDPGSFTAAAFVASVLISLIAANTYVDTV